MGQNKRQSRSKEWYREQAQAVVNFHVESVCQDLAFEKLIKEGLIVKE